MFDTNSKYNTLLEVDANEKEMNVAGEKQLDKNEVDTNQLGSQYKQKKPYQTICFKNFWNSKNPNNKSLGG